MGAKNFKGEWRRLRDVSEADIGAIGDAARARADLAVMGLVVDAAGERARSVAGDQARGEQEAEDGAEEARAMFGRERARRQILWAACAEAIERIEASLDAEMRSVVAPAGFVPPFSIRPEEAGATASDCAREIDAVERAFDQPFAGSADADVEIRLARCRQRLLSLRERARSVAPAPAVGSFKFGRPLSLEAPFRR